MNFLNNDIMFYLLIFALGAGFCGLIPVFTNKLLSYKCTKKGMDNPIKVNWNLKSMLLLSFSILALFISSAKFFNAMPNMLAAYIFTVIAVVCTIVDYKMRIIPNEMVLLVLVLGICYRAYIGGLHGLLSSLIALLLVVGIFLICMIVMRFIFKSKDGIGAGDIKISAAIAVAVGYSSVFTFLIGLSGAVMAYCLGGILTGRLTMKSTFPMCGVIMVGFLVALYEPFIIALI